MLLYFLLKVIYYTTFENKIINNKPSLLWFAAKFLASHLWSLLLWTAGNAFQEIPPLDTLLFSSWLRLDFIS